MTIKIVIALSEQFLTKTQAAAKLEISVATLDRKVKAGVLVPYPHSGKEVLFKVVDVEEIGRLSLALTGDLPKVYWLEPGYLKAAREQAVISQHDLAELSGITRGKIFNFESGVTVPTLEDASRFYAPLEQRGSYNALRALIGIVGTERGMTALTVRALETESDSIMERHASAMALLGEQEARLAQLMSRISDYREFEEAATRKEG